LNIYHYDPNTNEYLDTSTAAPDPLTPGEFLIPGYATTVEPPSVVTGKAAVFADGQWSEVDDYRGSTVYSTANGESKEVDHLGEVDDGYTLFEPADFDEWDGGQWVKNTAAEIAYAKSSIKALAQEKIYLFAPAWKQANMQARALLLERAERINGALTIDEQSEFDLLMDVWARVKAIRDYSDTLELAVESDPGMDITQGWPE
jgi:hypothetical protein